MEQPGSRQFEAGLDENLIEPFRLGLFLHQTGARHNHRIDVAVHALAVDDPGDRAQILDAPVGAGADEHAIERDCR